MLAASNPPLVGNGAVSVVPDLMRVYESMTQSSTPQIVTEQNPQQPHPQHCGSDESKTSMATATAGAWNQTEATNQHHHHPQHEEPWSTNHRFGPTELPVPPIPEAAMAVLSLPPVTSSMTEATPSTIHTATVPPFRSASSGSTKNTRKRSQMAALASQTSSTAEDSESDDTRQRRKTKQSKTDARWSKRFTWPENLHRDFCSAIFDVGLKHASPTQVLEFMPQHPDITSERIKSHLQKYRIHRVKSKQEFMSAYDDSLRSFQSHGVDPKLKALAGGGQVAAYLTYAGFLNEATSKTATTSQAPRKTEGATAGHETTAVAPHNTQPPQRCLVLPRLSDAEKRSPLGMSLGYLMGLFFSLKQQLMAQRAAQTGTVVGTTAVPAAMPQPGATSLAHPSFPQPTMGAVDVHYRSMNSSATGGAVGSGNVTSSLFSEGPITAQRSTLEESTLMKREMDNQMAFQNKMRALKEQELSKYRTTSSESAEIGAHSHSTTSYRHHDSHDSSLYSQGHPDDRGFPSAASTFHSSHDHHDNGHDGDYHHHGDGADHHHGLGEYGDHGPMDSRSRNVSFGAANDEFWNADMMDDQLFEFLMNN